MAFAQSLLLLTITLFYTALFGAFVTSKYKDFDLEIHTKGMLVADDVIVSSYACAVLTIANLLYVILLSITESQPWPKLFLVATFTQAIAKLLYVAAVSWESFPFHYEAVDYTGLAQGLVIAYSQCLICFEIFELDTKGNLLDFGLLLFFSVSSCSNVLGVYLKMIGLRGAEYFMVPFLLVLYFIGTRWFLCRSTSKSNNGLAATSKIDALFVVFIFPNMSHLVPRLVLLGYGKAEDMYTPKPWLMAVTTISTTVAYGLSTILFRHAELEVRQAALEKELQEQLDEVGSANESKGDEEESTNTLEEEIIRAAAWTLSLSNKPEF